MEGSGAGAAAPEGSAAWAGSPPASPSEDRHARATGADSSSTVLDLSRSGLQHLGDILKTPTLKQLHLQRNALCTIPPDFFQLLPSLTWLDLRHNKIEVLPPGIGAHRYLKTLLLERNPIKMLPVELGNVRTLRALNLRHCPVEFPPQLVVQQGSAAVLRFLRACASGPAAHAIPPHERMDLSQLPHPHRGVSEECTPSGETANSLAPEGPRPTDTVGPFPPIRKLDLSEPERPLGSREGWPSAEEIRRFWKLRQEIVEKEQVEVLEDQVLAWELPPNLRAMLRTPEEAPANSRHILRKKTPSLKGVPPGLEERRAAALRELQEQQALMGQRRRDQRVLQAWREQAQAMKRKTEELRKLMPPRRSLGASEVPFATDLPDKARVPVNPPGRRTQSRERSLRARDELRAGHEGALEERLKRHIRQMHEQRKVFRGTTPLEEIRKATEDLEIARKLQDEVMKQKAGPTLSSGHQRPALPGDLPLCPSASQPQNVFANLKY